MAKKNMTMSKEMSANYCHPHKQGKALLNLGIGLVLLLFGFNYISINWTATLLGLAFLLKGFIKMWNNSQCGVC